MKAIIANYFQSRQCGALSFLLAAVFALAAQTARAAATWTGAIDGYIKNVDNYSEDDPSWGLWFKSDNLTGNSTTSIYLKENLSGDWVVKSGSSEKHHHGLNFQKGDWELHSQTSESIFTYSNTNSESGNADRYHVKIAESGDASLRLYDLNLTTKYLYLGLKGHAGSLTVDSNGTLTITSDNFSIGCQDANSSGSLTVNNGGKVSAQKIFVGNAANATGTLTVNGGTVENGSNPLYVGYAADATGYLYLNGGTVVTRNLFKQNGTGTVVFNGGTLRAREAYSQYGGLTGNANLALYVGARGGTIHTGGFGIHVTNTLAHDSSLGDVVDGGMTFKGGGSATITAEQGYTGGTTVEIGTTLKLNSTSASSILANLAVAIPETAPAEGVYTLITTDGDYTLDPNVLGGIGKPEGATLRLSSDHKSILCVYGNPANTWIGGSVGSLSSPGNWSLGYVPQSGDGCVIGNTAAATLTVGDTFAPASITFAADSAAVTISGDAITGVAAVTNLSSASHTINARVNFAGAIAVAQNARGYPTRTQSHVTFAGGAHAAAGCTIADWGAADAGYSHVVFGKYCFANTASSPFTAKAYQVSADGDCRFTVTEGASLYIPYAGDMREIEVLSGAKVDVGSMAISGDNDRVSHKNFGEMAVTNLAVASTKNKYLTNNQGTDTAAVFKFNAITNSMTANWFYLADANAASKHTIYIGDGGLNFEGTAAAYCIGAIGADDFLTIRPWYSNFTIANRSDSGQAFIFNGGTTVFNTTDESGTGRTITVDAKTRVRYSSTVNVSGSGTLKLNKSPAYDSDKTMAMAVSDSATLSLASGVTLGATTAVAAGATLEVAESGTVTPGADLSLADGATLKFTFTQRKTAPVVDMTDKSVTFGDQKRPMQTF